MNEKPPAAAVLLVKLAARRQRRQQISQQLQGRTVDELSHSHKNPPPVPYVAPFVRSFACLLRSRLWTAVGTAVCSQTVAAAANGRRTIGGTCSILHK